MSDIHFLQTLTDAEVVSQFQNTRLAPEHLSHLGHLRLGWLYLHQMETEQAIRAMHADLNRMATSLGAAMKYHVTITEATMRLMVANMADEASWQDWVAQHPLFETDMMGVLQQYYSKAVLMSEQARCQWMEPDIQALPSAPVSEQD